MRSSAHVCVSAMCVNARTLHDRSAHAMHTSSWAYKGKHAAGHKSKKWRQQPVCTLCYMQSCANTASFTNGTVIYGVIWTPSYCCIQRFLTIYAVIYVF